MRWFQVKSTAQLYYVSLFSKVEQNVIGSASISFKMLAKVRSLWKYFEWRFVRFLKNRFL